MPKTSETCLFFDISLVSGGKGWNTVKGVGIAFY